MTRFLAHVRARAPAVPTASGTFRRSTSGRSRGRTRSGPRCGDSAGSWRRSGPRRAPWDEVVVGPRPDGAARPGARPALVSRRAAQLRREPAALRRRRRRAGLLERARTPAAAEPPPSSGARWPRPRPRSRALGVGAGDRVAGFLPNLPRRSIAMLAAASLGAIWSSCSPDFGVERRARSVRPDPAQGARLRRRLSLRGQGDRLARAGARGARAAAGHRARRRRAVPRPRGPTSARSPGRRALGRAARRASRAGPRRPTPACRSTTRSTSCTRRARPASRSAWCTGPAARCSST